MMLTTHSRSQHESMCLFFLYWIWYYLLISWICYVYFHFFRIFYCLLSPRVFFPPAATELNIDEQICIESYSSVSSCNNMSLSFCSTYLILFIDLPNLECAKYILCKLNWNPLVKYVGVISWRWRLNSSKNIYHFTILTYNTIWHW